MILWLASFPRSGNTFLRIVLHRTYGLRSSTVYDVDGVAARVGAELVGYEDRQAEVAALRDDEALHVVKTHAPRDDRVLAGDRAICLVRDGRDALVSWARQRSEADGGDFRAELERIIIRPRHRPGTWDSGSWGTNVLSWLGPEVRSPAWRRLDYDDLVRDPLAAVGALLADLVPERASVPEPEIPSFAELHAHDGGFFRRGLAGTHADELPADLHQAFWERPDNASAMALLGMARPPTAGGTAH